MSAPKKPLVDTAVCKVCRTSFRFDPQQDAAGGQRPAPPICGFLDCRARHGWGPDEWAGRARMAGARERAGIGLNDLDREALARQGPTVTTLRRTA